MDLLSLPPEMINHILHYCSAKDACNLELVSKAGQPYANDEILWERYVKNDFINDYLYKPDNLTWKAWYGQKNYENSLPYQNRLQTQISIQNAAIQGNLVGRSIGPLVGVFLQLAPIAALGLFLMQDEQRRLDAAVLDWNNSDSFLTFLHESNTVSPLLVKNSAFIALLIYTWGIFPRITEGLLVKSTAVAGSICEPLFESTAALFFSIKPLTLMNCDLAKKNVKKSSSRRELHL